MEAKCTIYLRISTKEQMAENQLPQLLQLAESGGYEVAEIYQKNKSAWRAGHQRELAKLLADCRDGMCEYDAVLLWAIDRLTPEGIAKMLEWANIFKGVGVKVVSLNESWTDTTTPHGKFIFNIMAAVAALERQTISQRFRAGKTEERHLQTRSFVKGNPRCGCNLQRVVYRLGYLGKGSKQ